ncbi:Uncharacterized protein HZ326_3292 [Fusarium oxysporum f. sp. albedinis]|nr:Uncharacterized protein HZ326_3292 [Fusarium oxysporum f. sp. albedinis]
MEDNQFFHFVIYVLLHLLHLLSSVNTEIISHVLISLCYHHGSYRDHSLNDIKFWDSNGFLTGRDVTDQRANLHKYRWKHITQLSISNHSPFLLSDARAVHQTTRHFR